MGLAEESNKKNAGRKGGKTGGKARAQKLTPMQRSAIAKQGGQAKANRSNLPNRKTK